jgi:glutamate/aspartate transport system substrate-binding protein
MPARPSRLALLVLGLVLAAPGVAQERVVQRDAPARDARPARERAPQPVPIDSSPTLKRIRDSATLRMGVREASVPFSFLDAKGEPQGYSVDLCLKIAEAVKSEVKLAHLDVKYVPVTSANRIAMVKDGKVDLECGSTTNTRERQKDVGFAYTTFVAGIKMLAKKAANVKGIDDLRGKTVVVTKGTTSEKMIHQLNDERLLKLTILESPDHDQSFRAVADGKAVAFPMDDVLLYGLVSKSGKPDDYAVVGKYLSVEPYAIMLPKGDAGFERVVDRTLNELFVSGDIRRIYAKWFATPQLTVPLNQYLKEAFQVPNTYPAWP